MTIAEIVDVTKISQSFPVLPSRLVPRPHYLAHIEAYFDAGAQLVIVEGEEGYGKTTLLAQYAREHSQESISLFLRASSLILHDPRILTVVSLIFYDELANGAWFSK